MRTRRPPQSPWRARDRPGPVRRPGFERLAQRMLCAVSPLEAAVPLHFGPLHTAETTHVLSQPDEVDLYSATLQAGDFLDIRVNAQTAGSGLTSLLRVFNSSGQPLALDAPQGGDPHLTFQAATAGTYDIGVSSAPNSQYNPTIPGSGTPGGSTGSYTLDVRLTSGAPLLPDLTGASFRTGADMAASGDTVPVRFTVENRGGADPGRFAVQLVLAPNHLFNSSSQVLTTVPRNSLTLDASGRSFTSPAGLSVTLPPGLTSGDWFLGLRIVPDPSVPEAGLHDKSGVQRGTDWEPLTVVTPAPAGATDLSQVDAGLFTEVTGTVVPGLVSAWPFSVSDAQGDGEFKAEVVATNGRLQPRLTLSGPTGAVLIQTDSGQLVQSLQPGTYSLTVSAPAGAGNYRLTTGFLQTGEPFVPLLTGASPKSVAVGDFNADGVLDLVAANSLDYSVSVFLGNGDGTFQAAKVFPAGSFPVSVAVADLNGDGKPDLVVADKGDASVSVLLGNGDGTFQPAKVYAVGQRPGGVVVADFNGDGRPDLAVSNYRDGTISVLLGNGDGTFQTEQTYPVGLGPGKLAVADINGDGIPDLIVPNYSDDSVSVLLGKGDGSFAPEAVSLVGKSPYSVAVADLNGDGRPDIVVTNYAENDVSVLLGRGNGTFGAPQNFLTGNEPYSVAVADLNGDGMPDLVVSNAGDNDVSVLLGNGSGTFLPQQTFPVGKNPNVVAVGDFTGDGIPDIVTANKGDKSVSVLLGRGDGTFTVQQATPAPGPRPLSIAVADLNHDGRSDLVVANKGDDNVSVLLANADGSFQTRETYPVGSNPNAVVVADVNGDGIPDIITADYSGSAVSVLLGNGDGTFGAPRLFPAGTPTYAVAVADVNGDGKPDIITANKGDDTVSVLLGNGDGTFKSQIVYPVGQGVDAVAVADVNRDGLPDIVTSNFGDSTVSVLLGNKDGTFKPAKSYSAGHNASSVKVADVNGDGKPDIITANYGADSVSVLLGNGDGTFETEQVYPTGTNPEEVAVADINGDGALDLVTANYGDGTVSVLPGMGDGSFGAAQTLLTGASAFALDVADLNGDGKPDIITANYLGGTVSVLPGTGGGAFGVQETFGLSKNKYAVAVADINGDGKPDVVTTSLRQDTVSVLPGDGTGTFQQGATFAVGAEPTSVVVSDLNRDGRLDLVTTNSDGNSVSVLLGNGDGTFAPQQTFATGRSPRRVVIADVNGDGIPDLVVSNYNDDTISVLLGNGDGSFKPQEVFAVGDKPYALAVADVNDDGMLDILVTNAGSDTVSVMFNQGGGKDVVHFAPQRTFATGRQPFALAVADVNGDGIPDIVTANAFDNTVSVLLGAGGGDFQPQQTLPVGPRPYSVAVADVNGDGKPDIVTTNYGDNSVSVLLNDGHGSFPTRQTFPTDQAPVQAIVADVNGDGRPDLITVSNHVNAAGVLLGQGNGTFSPATASSGVPLSDTPFLADLDGDGIPDSIVLDRSGNILFRKGLPGADDLFAPPVVLNQARPARAIAIVRLGNQYAIAAADAHNDSSLSNSRFVFPVSLYTVGADDAVSRITAFSTMALPTSLAAADLMGNGLDDLIAANALDNSVTIALQTAPGLFAAPITVPVGITPSDIAVADVNADGLPDVIVTDQSSGDVFVVLNDATHAFSQTLRFRAGTGLYDIGGPSTGPAVSSSARSVSVVAGDFTGDGRNDLVVVNQGAHSFTVLSANGVGGFSDPSLTLTTSTSDGLDLNDLPGAVVAGDFNRDGRLDLAVLMEDTEWVWIYSGNGDGTFRHTFSIPVGDQATGLSVVPGSAPGLLDLLVGNGFGDVLHLVGKGDGTFQISGKRVSISVVPNLLGPGEAGVLVGNEQDNRVTVQAPNSGGTQYTPVQTLPSASGSGQLAPGDVEWFVLDKGATVPDAVVVGSGSNSVVVYRTTGVTNGVPSFAPAPRTYFVGTAPASISVADLNHDGIPDMLVANQGSNDVSVIFGSYDAQGHWVGTPGPRLKSGGDGPIAVALRPGAGGVSDLAVINGGSGTVTLLPGVGGGFFDDRQPAPLFTLGGALVQPPSFTPGTGLGYAVRADGAIARFDLNDTAAGAQVVFSGAPVLAAQALANGQVAVALSGGTVYVLTPDSESDTLIVTSILRPQGETPAVPSAINVVAKPGGQFVFLVSSQGSDTLSVFTQAVATPISGGTVGGGPLEGVAEAVAFSVASAEFVSTPISPIAAVAAGTSAIATSASTSATTSTSSGATIATVGVTGGLSLGIFTTPGKGSSEGVGEATLASVEGNTYLSVPVLDFGSERDDEAGAGSRRMPWLANEYESGDTSPLNRFVIGIDEALRDYQGANDLEPSPGRDPWREDLFTRPPTATTPGPAVTPKATEGQSPLDPTTWHGTEGRERESLVSLLPLKALAVLTLLPTVWRFAAGEPEVTFDLARGSAPIGRGRQGGWPRGPRP